MTSTPLTVVLVHGAWHGAWCWAPLQAELDRLGVPSYAPDLPGHGTSAEPLGDLHGDARCVVEVIDRLGTDVLLVGHSYGGAVISEAGARSPHVRRLAYLTAFVLDEGESMNTIAVLAGVPGVPESLLPTARRRLDNGTLVLDPVAIVPALYGHCTPEVQRASVARLTPQPIPTFTQAATAAAWRHLPSTYVRCTDDLTVPLTHQDAMAARCDEVLSLATDHSPFASLPSETAAIIAGLATRGR
jgi:pimeloyl-ACP methyl ester carboxylesterase